MRVAGRRIHHIEESSAAIHGQRRGSRSRNVWRPGQPPGHSGHLREYAVREGESGDHSNARIGHIDVLAGRRDQNLSWIRIRLEGRICDLRQSAAARIDGVNGNTVAVIVGHQQVLAGRINDRHIGPVAGRSRGGGLRQSAVVGDAEDRDGIGAGIDRVEKLP